MQVNPAQTPVSLSVARKFRVSSSVSSEEGVELFSPFCRNILTAVVIAVVVVVVVVAAVAGSKTAHFSSFLAAQRREVNKRA
eukprot:TRINITY_DN12997_c0_g1_i1.p1 TRINITY_DN12997_c0_g1~~TRINITY_DN12997_c0_g1_i1.p1  ORF type:complete len:82 (-),score=12.88 TRINITY_DN12997_c0_g1_i1:66-311(-)